MYTFYTKSKDKKSVAQNSGIRIKAFDPQGLKTTYYRYIEDIWELHFGERMQMPTFKC
jgi:hypothetical protein